MTKEDLSEMPLPVRLQMTKDLLQSMMDDCYLGIQIKFSDRAESELTEIHFSEAIRQLRYAHGIMKPYIKKA